MWISLLMLSQIVFSDKNNIPSSGSDAGAGGHGTVVFDVVTTVPCSGINVIFSTQLFCWNDGMS